MHIICPCFHGCVYHLQRMNRSYERQACFSLDMQPFTEIKRMHMESSY